MHSSSGQKLDFWRRKNNAHWASCSLDTHPKEKLGFEQTICKNLQREHTILLAVSHLMVKHVCEIIQQLQPTVEEKFSQTLPSLNVLVFLQDLSPKATNLLID